MAKEIWAETRIKLDKDNFNKDFENVARDFISPMIKDLEKIIGCFYFLGEDYNSSDEYCVMLRIRPTNNQDTEEIISTMNTYLKGKREYLGPKIDKTDYEIKNYGEGAWKTVQKFFEFSNRLTLVRLDDNIKKEKEFNQGKFVHCFLNQWGNTIGQELNFHLGAATDRIMTLHLLRGKPISPEQAIEELKNIVKTLRLKH